MIKIIKLANTTNQYSKNLSVKLLENSLRNFTSKTQQVSSKIPK